MSDSALPPADHAALRQLAALNRISRIALQDMELRPMLQRIVDALYEEFGWEFIAFAGIDRERNEFVCDAVHAWAPGEVRVGYRRALGTGVVGLCASTGQTLDIPETLGHPDVIDTLGGTRSELCVPVLHNGSVIAVLNVESVRPGTFNGQRDLLETVASQISGALHAADLLRRLIAANASLELAYRDMALRAQQDGLTGIANRRCFDQQLDEACVHAMQDGQPLSLLLADVDHFKTYNDHHGHLAGDECLRRIASTLSMQSAAVTTQVARYGGEEFAVILPNLDGRAAQAHAESLLLAVAALGLTHLGSPLGRISLSIGVATLRTHSADTPSTLIARADVMLYAAKRGGRDRVCAEA